MTRQLQLPDARWPLIVGPQLISADFMEIYKKQGKNELHTTSQLEDDIWDCLEMGCLPPRSGLFNVGQMMIIHWNSE